MDSIKRWRDELSSQDMATRAAAAEQLCLAGRDAAEAAIDLVRACADQESIREWAVAALESLGPPPPKSQEALVLLTREADPLVAYWAVTLLGRMGPAAANGQQQLTDTLDTSPDLAVRERAAWALGRIGELSASALRSLQQAAKSDSPRLSRLARESLEQAGR